MSKAPAKKKEKGTIEERMEGALGADESGDPVFYDPDTGAPVGEEPTAENE